MKFATFMVVFAVAAQLAAASIIPVDGDYALQYGTDAFQTDFSAQVGQTVDVDVYLYETLNMQTFLLNDYDGLSGVGVKIERVSLAPAAADPTEPAYVANVDAIVPNSNFDEPNPNFSPIKFVDFDGNNDFIAAGLNEYIYYASPSVQPEVYDASTLRIYIGTFTFTVGNVAGEVTNFNITDFNDTTFDTVAGDPESPIDHLISDFQFSITAIPEPASMSLLALGAMAAVARKRR